MNHYFRHKKFVSHYFRHQKKVARHYFGHKERVCQKLQRGKCTFLAGDSGKPDWGHRKRLERRGSERSSALRFRKSRGTRIYGYVVESNNSQRVAQRRRTATQLGPAALAHPHPSRPVDRSAPRAHGPARRHWYV